MPSYLLLTITSGNLCRNLPYMWQYGQVGRVHPFESNKGAQIQSVGRCIYPGRPLGKPLHSALNGPESSEGRLPNLPSP